MLPRVRRARWWGSHHGLVACDACAAGKSSNHRVSGRVHLHRPRADEPPLSRLTKLGRDRGSHHRNGPSLGRGTSERYTEIATEFVFLKVAVIVTTAFLRRRRDQSGALAPAGCVGIAEEESRILRSGPRGFDRPWLPALAGDVGSDIAIVSRPVASCARCNAVVNPTSNTDNADQSRARDGKSNAPR